MVLTPEYINIISIQICCSILHNHHKLQGISRVMVEWDSRMRGSGQLPKPAGITGIDAIRDLTNASGHVVMQKTVHCCLSTGAEATMEQIHGQGVAEDLRMADIWQKRVRREDFSIQG